MNQQCVVYLFKCDLCDADYVGYTCRHLHQRIDEHKSSVVGELMVQQHAEDAKNIEVEFEWSLSVGHTSLEPHSHEVVINNIANVWLEILEHLDNLPRNNRNGKRKKFQLRNV